MVVNDEGKVLLVQEAVGPLRGRNIWKIPTGLLDGLHVTQGTIYHEIIKAAQDVAADAIVVGAHRPALRDYLVGPNAARVVRHAPQSVIVIR